MTQSQDAPISAPLSASTVAMLVSSAVAYGHIVGGIYLIAFWRRFGFQPFQHGGVAELLPAGIASVGVLVVLVFLGSAVGQLIGEALSASSVPAPVGRWVVGLLSLGFVAFFIWGPASRWWLALGLFLQFAFTLCLMRLRILPERFRSVGVATGIAVAAGYAPSAASYVANLDADEAITSDKGWVVTEATTGLPAREDQLLKYVGRLGESMVFYAPCSGRTWLVAAHSNQLLVHRKASSNDQEQCRAK